MLPVLMNIVCIIGNERVPNILAVHLVCQRLQTRLMSTGKIHRTRDEGVAISVDANITEFYRLMNRNITNEAD